MYREQRVLPIQVSLLPTKVRLLKGRPKVETMDYPILYPSTWLRYMLGHCSEIILGGFNISSVPGWQAMLQSFWSKFQASQPEAQVADPKLTIPIALHGDEGRGKNKRPIMCIGWQPLISYLGPAVTNTSGCKVAFRNTIDLCG